MKRGELRVDITLLDDISVLAMLAALPNKPHYTVDARREGTLPGRTPYYQAQRSENGRYLSGLLDLFGGLHPAASVPEERYWRRMFDLLSGRAAHTDKERLKEVGNALRKRLGGNRAQFYEDDTALTWLTNYVLKSPGPCLRHPATWSSASSRSTPSRRWMNSTPARPARRRGRTRRRM